MPSSRRRFVQALGATGLFSFGGCLTDERGAEKPATETTTSRTTVKTTAQRSPTTAEPTSEQTPAVAPTYEKVRGEAAPVSASQKFTENDGYEYLEEEDEVRYVAAYRSSTGNETRAPVYDTISFDDWATSECASVARQAVMTALYQALGESNLDSIVASVRGRNTGSATITILHQTVLSRSGSVVSQPTIPFDELVATTPRSATGTVNLDGAEPAERTSEVWVDDWVIQEE
ncbi:hypothetical protein E6P09_01695 [Haloferax mediterranei ATCC 33500]|uniref:Lipoprotein n=1 Tax=Haloferax mediterranei (strain ATCC 33500 / DSM 1411 / JCM 8866 / NBRC 14739 / NCIMB 2177 / R-4) TaxID=523841 RepID=I3R632_HALMT|nr:hypothetical protein [Haloferax mediterranei]AFK19692.1 hypothetical protein HFX_2000 [Haloferax mediterranei ATCC 33500]AHZ23081.1 hypothetical protein BM92_10735 [Haloferax mediterranei ATCC 33500]EMA00014.1 hypothetical protein C439_11778 [Haloferax mediterranei ATCC 33500]MDX5987565.1 hypothetical protein [Haloferax mediterranei ATCC 33500]QCQ74059.1 hypothetical protein E6P09_01695 [Haloferax mediterranei ATCC 33500]